MTAPLRVLVCGGREFGEIPEPYPTDADIERAARERAALNGSLDALHAERGIACVIHGACTLFGDPCGADHVADKWAKRNGVPPEPYPADWRKYGRAAGPIRNAKMLREGKPDLVLAAPGSRGTADMVRQARAAGVRVREVG